MPYFFVFEIVSETEKKVYFTDGQRLPTMMSSMTALQTFPHSQENLNMTIHSW